MPLEGAVADPHEMAGFKALLHEILNTKKKMQFQLKY